MIHRVARGAPRSWRVTPEAESVLPGWRRGGRGVRRPLSSPARRRAWDERRLATPWERNREHWESIGSSVNRSLTAHAARAGRGAEVVIGLDDDPGDAARRLVARTRAPLLTDLVLDGSALVGHAPSRLPDVLAGGPALVAVTLQARNVRQV
jgi:hypothetical protein